MSATKNQLMLSEAVQIARGHADPERDIARMYGDMHVLLGIKYANELSDDPNFRHVPAFMVDFSMHGGIVFLKRDQCVFRVENWDPENRLPHLVRVRLSRLDGPLLWCTIISSDRLNGMPELVWKSYEPPAQS